MQYTSVRFENINRPIGGTAVDSDDFDIVVPLRSNAIECLVQVIHTVVNGHHHG